MSMTSGFRCVNFRRWFVIFSTTPAPSHQRVIIFSTTTQGIRLRRRVDVFQRHRTLRRVDLWLRRDIDFSLDSHYNTRPLCLSKVTFPPMSPCRICRLIKCVCHHGVLMSDVDRVERFRLILRLFDDVSTTS